MRSIWIDARHDSSFYWKWGLIFAILGLLFNIWVFMVMGAVLLTLAICSEMANEEEMNGIFGPNKETIDEQTSEDQQGDTGTTDR